VEGEGQAGFVVTVDVNGLRLNSSRPVVTMRNKNKVIVLTFLACSLFSIKIYYIFSFSIISTGQLKNTRTKTYRREALLLLGLWKEFLSSGPLI
jgi:hypothetical protein